MAKTKKKKPQASMEETLWDTANKLRGKVESSEYKHVVLSLIFLKFVSDKFERRRAQLVAEGKEKYLEMKEFYTMQNVFFLTPQARWSHIMAHAKQDDVALKIDTALHTIEQNNPSLQGALPDNYFSRLGLDGAKLSALLDTINNIDTVADREEDVVGRVYEYFLGRFAAAEGKGGGEFYTPKCIVKLLTEVLEPYKGKVYDPCCGSGGMFVQSIKFVENHHGNSKDISIYGQEYTATTYKLAKMNLAIRGISANLGEAPANTFFRDQHPDLKADFILANPPFNQKQWRADEELVDDARWMGYRVPPTGNANYAWILHMLSKLSEGGTAGFVLANGSMSSQSSGEGELRQQLVENDLVDCMIALPGQLFYTTQIPVCLWFLTKTKTGVGANPSVRPNNPGADTRVSPNKPVGVDPSVRPNNPGADTRVSPNKRPVRVDPGVDPIEDPRVDPQMDPSVDPDKHPRTALRDRRGETLFIDARQMGRMVDRTHKELTDEDIARIADTYHAWRSTQPEGVRADPSVRPDVVVGADTRVDPNKRHVRADPGVRPDVVVGANTRVGPYHDIPGFCKAATREEIAKHDYVLTPGRYVGVAEEADDGIPFEEKMEELTATLYEQLKESNRLDALIRQNLEGLGYEE